MDFGLWENYYKKYWMISDLKEKMMKKLLRYWMTFFFEQGCLTLEDLYEKVDFSTKFIIFGAGPSLKDHIKK